MKHICVLVEGQFSNSADVKSGVPQGSLLGTLLSLVYLNGLSGTVTSKTQLFVDDILCTQ
ncbi:hypothetical protein DPMN_050241 [Dreissena polymorpha]|uniref:Reverse transcriptase domain-containing protein n=1 Tax=Dreissena polymorpha TaxID=45954 RepID=A0A9D4CFR4_DREPO|nr:hypothetical protein DPMN_050241 [Dreissena polymorpha]